MFSTRNERLGLLISTILFAIMGIAQLWRGLMNVSVLLNGHEIPAWVSLFAGLILLAMAFWMGNLLRHRRPIV